MSREVYFHGEQDDEPWRMTPEDNATPESPTSADYHDGYKDGLMNGLTQGLLALILWSVMDFVVGPLMEAILR